MSLVTTPTLRALYQLANTKGAQEHESVTFWNHVLNKIWFPEEHWVISPEVPPSSHKDDRRRRMDLGVSFFISFSQCNLDRVAVIEVKGIDGSKDEVEAQAQEASESCCRAGGSVWALTMVGTAACVWQWTTLPVKQFVDNTTYIDADSPWASRLSQAVMNMKSEVHPTGPLVLKSQPAAVTQQSAPLGSSNDASQSTTLAYGYAQMDGKWHWDMNRRVYYKYDKDNNDWVDHKET
ncbi:hypothetical protein EK21DRAFT_119045 [Setomelanomma holmii]|uniref:Uncharacterized protein n=1 Tax=Setomelanomma holmii TaxID=210430 RepID=A0A9P4GWJ0_9PLEO|nr:hypothetical protein EK21DRAFT_119045 [Setomelanomma holmii]